MTTPGTPITRRRRGRPVEYVAGSGLPWRTTLSFDPDNAEFIVGLIKQVHPDLSAATVINVVIDLLLKTKAPEGEPLTPASLEASLRKITKDWPAAEHAATQEELPMTG
ncbi:hypothetical protein [Streptomyces sp. NBRC 110465]|uniref:hypothetical protein n=1 Tax=Streptomyces sp. NBRC 110465 TaxID=1897621 RepID=UPI0011613E8A|nr:hypothetical protein [Streptomyces sp. NBRC 110465]